MVGKTNVSKNHSIEIPRHRSCDIDTPEDWQNALRLAKEIKLKA